MFVMKFFNSNLCKASKMKLLFFSNLEKQFCTPSAMLKTTFRRSIYYIFSILRLPLKWSVTFVFNQLLGFCKKICSLFRARPFSHWNQSYTFESIPLFLAVNVTAKSSLVLARFFTTSKEEYAMLSISHHHHNFIHFPSA